MIPGFQGRFSSGYNVLDGDLRGLKILTGPNGPVLYAATGLHGGIGAFGLTEGSLAWALPDPIFFAPGSVNLGAMHLALAHAVDGSRLMLTTGAGGVLSGFGLQASGEIGTPKRFGLPTDIGRIDGLASTRLTDGGMVHHVLDAGEGQISSFIETADGRLDQVTGVSVSGLETQKGASMAALDVGGHRYVVVAGSGFNSPGQVSSYRVDATTGAFEKRDSAGSQEGLGINTPTVMTSAIADNEAWVVVGDAASGSLSVLRVGADGSLAPTDYAMDTQYTRFGNLQAAAALETSGHVFVVAGGGDDGFSLFRLLPNGRLIHSSTVEHSTGLGLNDVTALEMSRVGDELQIFASSEGASGLSQFSVSLADLGQVISDVSPEGRTLLGTDLDDVILASKGVGLGGARDRLEGGDGDDTLVAGGDGSDLAGGAGSDLFVLAEGSHHILDFEPSRDRIDLSGLPFLRNPSQLGHQVMPDGAELQYRETTIRITTADGRPLALQDIWPEGHFSGSDHLPVGVDAPGQPGLITGTDEADRLEGSWVNEIFTGGSGADVFVLTQNMGADIVADFDPAEDKLDFSALDAVQQSALTSEQVGSNRVITLGDSSTLTLLGVDANSAPGGSVQMSGWAGTWQFLTAEVQSIPDPDGVASVKSYQWLRNGAEISGASADTYLLTSADVGSRISVRVSYMDGLGTREEIESNASAIVVRARYGGSSNNVMQGGPGKDFLVAGAGDDRVYGKSGGDTILGGDGVDELRGELGWDLLAGDAGNDRLWGGLGNDRLFGGAGADRLLGEGHDDMLAGGDGGDALGGGWGRDRLYGEAGSDRLWGGDGGDSLWGGLGEDRLWGGRHNDALHGGLGSDSLWGGLGNDRLWGDDEDDVLWGESGNDTLCGGTGNDALGGGWGRDTLYGEAGADRLWGGNDPDALWGGVGEDRLWGGRNSDALRGGPGADRLWGGPGNDRLWGDDENDVLWGEGGNDTLRGGTGNDALGGGWGRDSLYGEAGADRLWGGRDNDTMGGGSGDDLMWGEWGDDRLWGGDGNDLLVGGAGRDRLHGGAGADVFVFGKGHGTDRIVDFTPGEDLIRVSGGKQSFDALNISSSGADAVVGTGLGTVYLEGISASVLSSDDFLFV